MTAKEQRDVRLKRLRYRAWHRGIKEMDLILGPFADAHLASLEEEALDAFEVLLEEPDPLLYAWISDREAVPPEADTALLRRIRDFGMGRGRSET